MFKDQYSDDDYERCIRLDFDDESMIQGDDIDIFATDAFKRRRCMSIRFGYASKSYIRCLKIRLNNSALGVSDSEVEVCSSDQTWYDSMLNRLETIFSEVENQKRFARYPGLISIILSNIEAILLCITLFNLLSVKSKVFAVILLYGVLGSFLWLVNITLIERLKKAYPCIEFSFGPTHLNESLRLRQMIIVAIPFIIDVVFFVIGLFV